jgi:hypothetical protein
VARRRHDQLDDDRVVDAVMAPLANVTRRASSRSMRWSCSPDGEMFR